MDDRQLTAAYKLSREARTSAEHVAAAQALLGCVTPNARYVITPVCVSVAHVHAVLATVAPEES